MRLAAGVLLILTLGGEQAFAQASPIEEVIGIIENPAVINFISTFGLAVLLVLYFIFVRDPKLINDWKDQYKRLSDSYDSLSQNYNYVTNNLENVWRTHCESLQNDYRSLRSDYERVLGELDPRQRALDREQSRALCHACLDRDLYKLFYFVREKIHGREQRAVESHLQETILDTKHAWSQFKSPFPTVPKIFNLFGIYKDSGASLVQDINTLIESDLSEDEKIARAWDKLLKITIGMKGEFDECLQKLESQRADEILPHPGPVISSGEPAGQDTPSGSSAPLPPEEEPPRDTARRARRDRVGQPVARRGKDKGAQSAPRLDPAS